MVYNLYIWEIFLINQLSGKKYLFLNKLVQPLSLFSLKLVDLCAKFSFHGYVNLAWYVSISNYEDSDRG